MKSANECQLSICLVQCDQLYECPNSAVVQPIKLHYLIEKCVNPNLVSVNVMMLNLLQTPLLFFLRYVQIVQWNMLLMTSEFYDSLICDQISEYQ